MSEFKLSSAEDYLISLESNSVDMILTDPPYGINYSYGFNKKAVKASMENDKPGDLNWTFLLTNLHRVLKEGRSFFIFGRFDSLSKLFILNESLKLFNYVQDFVWYKGDMGSGNLKVMGTTHEMALHFSKGKVIQSEEMLIDGVIKKRVPAFFKGKVSSSEYCGHPTQKDVKMLEYIIKNRTKENDVVLDCFAGSGSTFVACENINRQYIGCEIDEIFFDMAVKRLNNKNKSKQLI